jgi:hypothetical protein
MSEQMPIKDAIALYTLKLVVALVSFIVFTICAIGMVVIVKNLNATDMIVQIAAIISGSLAGITLAMLTYHVVDKA